MTEEQIEQYSLGEAPEGELAVWEEHLLICGRCRRHVQESDVYVAAMQAAAVKLRRGAAAPERRRWRWLVPAFACPVLLALSALVWIRPHSVPAPVAISLAATRGPGIEATAPSRTPLRLNPDLTGLKQWPSYRLEVVDRFGKRVWQGAYPGAVTDPLGPGVYFIRISSPQGDLYREYGLEVAK